MAGKLPQVSNYLSDRVFDGVRMLTADETEAHLKRLKRQIRRVEAAAKKRGYQRNPRLAEMYADLERTQPGGSDYIDKCTGVDDD